MDKTYMIKNIDGITANFKALDELAKAFEGITPEMLESRGYRDITLMKGQDMDSVLEARRTEGYKTPIVTYRGEKEILEFAKSFGSKCTDGWNTMPGSGGTCPICDQD